MTIEGAAPRRSWFARLPSGLAETFTRFPLPVIIAAALTLYHLNKPWPLPPISTELEVGLNWAAFLGIFWCAAAVLLGEARRSPVAAWALQAIGVAFLVWLFSLPQLLLGEGAGPNADFLFLTPPTLIGAGFLSAALFLLLGLAPYTGWRADSEVVWQFTHKLWVGLLMGLIGALIFFLGVTGVIVSIETLFEVKFPDSIWFRVTIVSFILVQALLSLTLIPRDLAEPTRKGRDMEFTSRAVALLVKFIFAPLVWVFFFILAAYCVKVLALGEFSEARLGQISVIYGCCVVAVAALAYPTRDAGAFMRLFWRAWPFLLLPSVGLLVAALDVRLSLYGVTVPRYVNVIAAIWLGALAAIFILSRSRADIRFIPGLLALLLILAAFGPWSAVNVSGRSQAAILEDIMASRGLLADGRWTEKPAADIAWDAGSRNSAGSALATLDSLGQIDRVAPWFAGAREDPFRQDVEPKKRLAELQKAMNLPALAGPGLPPDYNERERFYFNASTPYRIEAPAPSVILGPISIYNFMKGAQPQNLNGENQAAVNVSDDGRHVIVESGGRLFKFDLREQIREIIKLPKDASGGRNLTQPNAKPFVLKAVEGGEAWMILTFISGSVLPAEPLDIAGVAFTFYLVRPADN